MAGTGDVARRLIGWRSKGRGGGVIATAAFNICMTGVCTNTHTDTQSHVHAHFDSFDVAFRLKVRCPIYSEKSPSLVLLHCPSQFLQ